MAGDQQFGAAMRKLDAALQELAATAAAEPSAEAAPAQALPQPEAQLPGAPALAGAAEREQAGAPNAHEAVPPAAPAAPTTEALTRLFVGTALLGLDGLGARSATWEAAAGIARRPEPPAPAEGAIGSGRFRYALIGWLFESEARLRPQGNPISWLRAVVLYMFSTVFAVLIELLPLPRPGVRRNKRIAAEPTDEDTRRWINRGLAEEAHSRRFTQAALGDLTEGWH